jgi:hypothetical protein
MFFCALAAWNFYEGPPRYRWLAVLIVVSFTPTLLVLKCGQSGLLILTGAIAFLYCERQQRGWLMGASTVLLAFKPQLVFLFWWALLFWSLHRRQWQVLGGGLLTGLLLTAIPSWFHARVLLDYFATLLYHHSPQTNITPTLGSLLRLGLGREHVWLQLLPMLAGLVAFPFYYWRHRLRWNWAEQLPRLLLVSLVLTFYEWPFDMVVLLLPILQTTVELVRTPERARLVGAGLFLVLFNLGSLLLNLTEANQLAFLWMPPSLLLAYLLLHQVPAPAPRVPLLAGEG